MNPTAARLDRWVRDPVLSVLAVVLFAVRFAAPSASAALGVAGYETSGFDAAMLVFDGLLPLIAGALVAAVILLWPRGLAVTRWIPLTLFLVAADVVLWLGEAVPSLRLVEGPWASLPLGVTAAATIAVWGLALDRRLRLDSDRSLRLEGFRAVYLGFTLAYLLGSLRFIDYRYALGVALPPGVLWLLDYGPVLLLGGCSVFMWLRVALPGCRGTREPVASLAFPLLGILAGVAVSQGLAGFILSNTLAWGGAYEVFTPTAVSLGFVGLAVGCFISVALMLRGRITSESWRFLVAGVSVASFAGILAFGGTLASVAGILLGLVLAARGLASA